MQYVIMIVVQLFFIGNFSLFISVMLSLFEYRITFNFELLFTSFNFEKNSNSIMTARYFKFLTFNTFKRIRFSRRENAVYPNRIWNQVNVLYTPSHEKSQSAFDLANARDQNNFVDLITTARLIRINWTDLSETIWPEIYHSAVIFTLEHYYALMCCV